ncbi:MAG: hydrogenase nickel incorporation protein HypB [Chloroflexi bacterium]|nr:hydrogenase nickel incorporation protein HypB [Chloroflexota bacterium]
MPRRVPVLENILGANDRLADENRARLDQACVLGINLMASPGAGKTSLIERTVRALAGKLRLAVIDGDIATSLDADRATAAGATAIQINTGGECHLDAVMVQGALQQLDLFHLDLLIVENVGNLICPAAFRLGTHHNVLIASVPEGDDKPYKYPGMYRGVDVLLINKVDLLPYVAFDMGRFQRGVELLNPGVATFAVSCRTGEGLSAWLSWVEAAVAGRLMDTKGPQSSTASQ